MMPSTPLTTILKIVLMLLLIPGTGGIGILMAQTDRFVPVTTGSPRILLLRGEEHALRAKLEQSPLLTRVHEIIIRECDILLDKPPVTYKKTGRRLLSVSREARRRIFYLAYAWRMTDDRRYLKRAETECIAVTEFPDWNPSHFLDVAEMTMGLAIGYDWLYDGLSPGARHKLRTAIVDKGLRTSLEPRYNGWLNFANNWNQVCNAGLVFGALSVLDSEPVLAKQIISRAVETLPLAMKQYAPDGGYPEGHGYWSYGTTFNVLLIAALEKAFNTDFGLSDCPGFLKTGLFRQHLVGPTGKAFNYSDNSAADKLDPALFWLSSRTGNTSLLYSQMHFLREGGKIHRERELPAVLIWSAALDSDQVDAPETVTWVGKGSNQVAMFRTSWDQQSLFLGIKGGSPSESHGHMDVGSFVFDALGERWVEDPGVVDYNTLEQQGLDIWSYRQHSDRWKVWHFSNHAHSTLSFDSSLQRVDGTGILTEIQHDSLRGAIMDVASLYDSVASWKRGVAIWNDSLVVVADEFRVTKDMEVTWKIITLAGVEIMDASCARLTRNGKSIWLVAGPGVQLKTWSVNRAGEQAPFTVVAFRIRAERSSVHKVNVTMSPFPAETLPVVPPLSHWSTTVK
jgi:hypothetical protein